MYGKCSVAIIAMTLFVVCPSSSTAQRLKLSGGPVVIDLDPIIHPVGEDGSSQLQWNKIRSPSKIVVSSSSAEQRFELFVDATSVQRGDPVGELSLVSGAAAQDLVVGITERAAGRCTLIYRASARAEDGHGEETHTVTYTITGQ
ncbi:MAG: hypothetical protein HKN13_04020 [Rhodothermales bacterium]|nr:hypothetical protein [Rhodothermales bacterium]